MHMQSTTQSFAVGNVDPQQIVALATSSSASKSSSDTVSGKKEVVKLCEKFCAPEHIELMSYTTYPTQERALVHKWSEMCDPFAEFLNTQSAHMQWGIATKA